MMKTILIAQHNSATGYFLRRVLKNEHYRLLEVAHYTEFQDRFSSFEVDLVILDIDLPGPNPKEQGGLTMLRWARDLREIPVIVITATKNLDELHQSHKLGAHEYMVRPLDAEVLLNVVREATERSQVRRIVADSILRIAPYGLNHILGTSQIMTDLKALIRRVASYPSPVMILGESGTGKEMAARAIHMESDRRNGPFIDINCTAIPGDLAEAELFGFERGAYTGAIKDQPGKIEQAAGGTLFLDEIGDMPLSIQSKLLRALDLRQIIRLGSKRVIPVDFRVVAATNAKLASFVHQGRFRQDLYYRLNVIEITMPPLRERPEDILLLTQHFVKESVGSEVKLAPHTEQALLKHNWPGNVRELRNAVQRARIYAGARIHDIDTSLYRYCQSSARLSQEAANAPQHSATITRTPPSTPELNDTTLIAKIDELLGLLIDRHAQIDIDDPNLARWLERRLVDIALERAQNNKSRAARLVGMDRKALQRRLKKP